MLVQLLDVDGNEAILYEVSDDYTLADAEKEIRAAYKLAKEKEDKLEYDEFEEDFYIHDEVEENLPKGFTRVYTEIITCVLF
jgi:hypothetical protein